MSSFPINPISSLHLPPNFTRQLLNFDQDGILCLQVVETPIPRWLKVLLEEKFFQPCLVHEIVRKNDKNVLCLDCCIPVCFHCLSPHHSHRLLQIRRYVYHDVIRLDDAEKLFDSTSVQSYINNGAKVVFINQRPQTRLFRASGNICLTCERCLQDPFLFCSLSCKVMHLLKTEGGVSDHLLECKYLPLSGSGELDDGQMTPESVLEPACSAPTSSGSSCGGGGGAIGALVGWFSTAATTEIVRKKRSNLSSGRTGSGRVGSPPSVAVDSPPPSAQINRRKKSITPHRSPLY